jgi:ABC-type antimicrobial peptide transport system permease subunit
MFWENIRMALREFAGNRMRTFLSLLGIVIGIGSVISITTLGQSATASVQKQVAQGGLETIMVFPGRDAAKEVRRLFTVELGERLKSEVQGVREVTPLVQAGYFLKHGRDTYENGTVLGVQASFPGIYSYQSAAGAFLSEEDVQKRRSVVVLGAEIAAALFPEGQALDQYVRIYRKGVARSFKVVGVMEAKTGTMGMDFDGSAYIPYETYSSRLERLENVQRYAIGTVPGVDVLKVSEKVDEFFTRLTGNEDSFRVMSPSTIAEMFTNVTKTLNLFLTGVAAISLVVGGIGIMNIMLVSVAERTKEIGIRKALGAAPRAIRGQFLTEAVTLTLVGGLVGMALGTALSFLATALLKWTFAPQAASYALAVACSSAVGIFFGLYPAARAARLQPVEALSFE